MVINNLNRPDDGIEFCSWCGHALTEMEEHYSMAKVGKRLHDYCIEDFLENRHILGEGLYPLEDGMTMSIPYKDKRTFFNIITNRYEYICDNSPVDISGYSEQRPMKKTGLPWERDDINETITTPDGSSSASGWGEKSTWGDPRPLA